MSEAADAHTQQQGSKLASSIQGSACCLYGKGMGRPTSKSNERVTLDKYAIESIRHPRQLCCNDMVEETESSFDAQARLLKH
jgi:hypothetical protein